MQLTKRRAAFRYACVALIKTRGNQMNPYNLCKQWQARSSRNWTRKTASCAFAFLAMTLLVYPVWRALAAGGNLDTSFSGDGKYVLPHSPSYLRSTKVPDVRIQIDPNNPQIEKVIAPYSNFTGSSIGDCISVLPYDFAVTRLTSTGLRDTSFGEGGVREINFNTLGFTLGKGKVTALELQTNGKILVAGNLHDCPFNSNSAAGLARLTFDGDLDTSFGNGGRWAFLGISEVLDMAVQPDGKIILVGRSKVSAASAWKSAIWRINANGTNNTSFGTNGFVSTTVWPANSDPGYIEPYEGFKSVYVESDGKIMVLNSSPTAYRLRRFTTSGSLDIYWHVNAAEGSFGNTIKPAGSNIWVVGAKIIDGVKYGAIFARQKTNGSSDTTFAGGAGVALSAQPSVWADVSGVLFSIPAKYVVVGWNVYPGPFPFEAPKAVITRYSGTGALDSTFGTNGSTEETDFAPSPYVHSRYFSVRIGLSGKIVTGGQAVAVNTYVPAYHGAVARYWGN
jgi:uncharacterized delta-60 repeat protein